MPFKCSYCGELLYEDEIDDENNTCPQCGSVVGYTGRGEELEDDNDLDDIPESDELDDFFDGIEDDDEFDPDDDDMRELDEAEDDDL